MTRFAILALTLSVSGFAQLPSITDTKVTQQNSSPRVGAVQQGNSKEDLGRTAAIRRAIAEQEDLSVDAKNVRVVTMNQRVFLRGPVRQEEERWLIAKIVADIAGSQNLKNEIEIAPASRAKK